jgi:hypothetical protein
MYKEHRDARTPSDDQIIYRYRNLDRFKQILSDKHLYFSRLDKLQDEHEGRYPEGNLKESNRESIAEQWGQEFKSALEDKGGLDSNVFNLDNKAEEEFIEDATEKLAEMKREDPRNYGWEEKARLSFFVNCWQIGDYESFPMWQAYTNPENSVVIVSTIGNLKEALSRHIKDHIYLGEVDYVDSQSGQISERGQLHLALQKRMEYRHEDEIRGILKRRPPKNTEGIEHPSGVIVKIDPTALVNEVRVSPEASKSVFNHVCNMCEDYGELEENVVRWSALK